MVKFYIPLDAASKTLFDDTKFYICRLGPKYKKIRKTEKNTFFKNGPAHGWSTLEPKYFGNHHKTYQALFSEG